MSAPPCKVVSMGIGSNLLGLSLVQEKIFTLELETQAFELRFQFRFGFFRFGDSALMVVLFVLTPCQQGILKTSALSVGPEYRVIAPYAIRCLLFSSKSPEVSGWKVRRRKIQTVIPFNKASIYSLAQTCQLYKPIPGPHSPVKPLALRLCF